MMMRKTSLILLGAAAGVAVTLIATQPRIVFDGARAPTPHMRDPKGNTIPSRGAVGVAYVREQKTEEVPQKVIGSAGSAKIAIMMRHRGKEVATDVPLTSRAIGELALIAMSRGLSIAELVGQALAGAIKKDMIKEILRDEIPSSAA